MSMRKLNSHTILQLWCCCHVMYKLLYPSIRVRTAPPVSVRGCGHLDTRSTRHMCRVDSFTKKSTRHRSQLDTRVKSASKFQSSLTAQAKSLNSCPTMTAPTKQRLKRCAVNRSISTQARLIVTQTYTARCKWRRARSLSHRHMHVM